jgi:hypothetical protein
MRGFAKKKKAASLPPLPHVDFSTMPPSRWLRSHACCARNDATACRSVRRNNYV